MKKLFGLAIAILAMFVMAVSFSACSDGDDDSSNSNTTAATAGSGSGSGSGTSGTGTAGSGTNGDGTATGSGTGSTSTATSIVYEGTDEITEDGSTFSVTHTVTFTTTDTSFEWVSVIGSGETSEQKLKGTYTGNPAANGAITLSVTQKYKGGEWKDKTGSLTGSIAGTTLTLTEVTGDNETLTYTLTRK